MKKKKSVQEVIQLIGYLMINASDQNELLDQLAEELKLVKKDHQKTSSEEMSHVNHEQAKEFFDLLDHKFYMAFECRTCENNVQYRSLEEVMNHVGNCKTKPGDMKVPLN